MNTIEIKSLKHSYEGNHEIHFPDWIVRNQEDALILGPSGSGKTTLLHVLSGLLRPVSGEITVNGNHIHQMKAAEMDQFRKSQVGIVFQQPHLIKSLSVVENLRLTRYLTNQPKDELWIAEIIEKLGLTTVRDRNVKQISYGQAQRVAIARAVMNKPGILFGDEPTANLDDENCEKVINLLKQQARLCNASLIIATHDQRVKHEFSNQLILKEPQA